MARRFLFVFIFIFWGFCSSAQVEGYKTNYTASEFDDAISKAPGVPVVDVRTPEEFTQGHLPNAVNYDWYGKNFEKQVATLDKKQPVFIYCLSGGRSAEASAKLRAEGFEKVYELSGGIMKWRSAGLPEQTDAGAGKDAGMTRNQFNELLNTEKTVLVDFYADWCAPCKKMKPYLEEISKDMADKVIVVRINADENKSLCKEMKIEEIPVLQIYRKGNLTWNHTGFIEKAKVVRQLK